MAEYCLDTSGLSNPWEKLPEDIYDSLWKRVRELIVASKFCCTKEIYDEMLSISGTLGDCIRSHSHCLVMEIGADDWDWEQYLHHIQRMQVDYASVISEFNGNRKGTVGLNDLSLIALARTTGLPVISMETANVYQPSTAKRRIPDICAIENVPHMDFNDLLRDQRIRL